MTRSNVLENGTQTWTVIHRHHSHLLDGDVGHPLVKIQGAGQGVWSWSSSKFENFDDTSLGTQQVAPFPVLKI